MSTSPPGTSYSGSTMSLLDDHTIRFAVVDVETSGLDPQRHLLLQVGVVVVDGSGQVLDRWASLIRPERRWWFSVGPTSIHGIRRRDVRGAPPAVDVLQRLARSLDGAVFVAHNASFDRSFLRAAADAHGVAVPLDPTLCTLQLSRRLDPERRLSASDKDDRLLGDQLLAAVRTEHRHEARDPFLRTPLPVEPHPAPQQRLAAAVAVGEPAAGSLGEEHLARLGPEVGILLGLDEGGGVAEEAVGVMHLHGVPRDRVRQTDQTPPWPR
jgi:hypothetical protein